MTTTNVIKLRYCVLTILLMLTGQASSQVMGKVVDASNGLPISNASVTFGEQGTTTDSLGIFKINAVATDIAIAHLGYESQQVVISDRKDLLILLQASTLNLNEVVITSYLSENRLLETPGPIALISKKELDRDQGVIITNSLNRIPGVYMHSGALNTNRITIRGIGSRSLFSTNRVSAYLNNIPLTTGEGETTIEDIDLSIVDRLEVLKGPASSIYGASLGGVINLKTKKGIETPFISTEFQLGSFGLTRAVSRIGWGNEKSANTITYTNTHSDGFRQNNEYDRESVLLTSNTAISKTSELSFLAQWTDLKSFIPSSINLNTFETNPSAAAPNWLAAQGFEDYNTFTIGASLKSSILPWLDNTTSIFGSFRNANEVRPFNILKENTNSVGFRSLFHLRPELGTVNPVFNIGISALRDNYNFSTQTPDSLQALIGRNNEIRKNINLFANSEWQLNEKLLIVAGVNLNITEYDLEDLILNDGTDQSGDYRFDNVLSPRLALNYLVRSGISLHASISHGFSPPTLEETLRPDGTINNDIQPEKGTNYEIGSRGNLFGNRLSYDVSLYHLNVNDLLVARRVDNDQFVGINAGKSRHQGLELALGYQLIEGKNNRASLNSSLTYTIANHEFVEFIDGDDDFSDNELPGNPSQVLNGVLDFDTHWGLFGNVNGQYVGDRFVTDGNDVTESGYFVSNIKVGYSKGFGKLKLTVYSGINNLFDEAYASQLLINASSFGGNAPRYYYPGLPRNYFGGMSLKWSFR